MRGTRHVTAAGRKACAFHANGSGGSSNSRYDEQGDTIGKGLDDGVALVIAYGDSRGVGLWALGTLSCVSTVRSTFNPFKKRHRILLVKPTYPGLSPQRCDKHSQRLRSAALPLFFRVLVAKGEAPGRRYRAGLKANKRGLRVHSNERLSILRDANQTSTCVLLILLKSKGTIFTRTTCRLARLLLLLGTT